MNEAHLAPCIAVVGPANSGKTTLLHGLDAALQGHPSRPLAYVVKGNPDGTGRYLSHAPQLRAELKERVKGRWSETTVVTVCGWVEGCRRTLDLVLVDLGGRHAPGNAEILRCCSHFIVLAPSFENAEEERAEGMESWVAACLASGLQPVARLRSLREGVAEVSPTAEALVGTFRANAFAASDLTNAAVLAALTEALLALCPRRVGSSYLDLRIGRDWEPADLVDLGGLASRIEERVRSGQPLVLGGRAPVWAYGAALHRALDADPKVMVQVFDPKVPGGLVRIGPVEVGEVNAELAASLAVSWRRPGGDRDGATLDLLVTTPDRFLRPPAFNAVAALPLPSDEPPAGTLVVSGAVPIWLHLAYQRLLRSWSGERALGVWDARRRSAVLVRGSGSPATVSGKAAATGKSRGETAGAVNLFVRCGERYEPPAPAGEWIVVELPHELGARDIAPAVERVRQALRGARTARLLVAGPVALGIALGQALAHEPVAIDYLQLNQVTKEYEVWVTNRRNL